MYATLGCESFRTFPTISIPPRFSYSNLAEMPHQYRIGSAPANEKEAIKMTGRIQFLLVGITAVAVLGVWSSSVSAGKLPPAETLERMVRFETCLKAAWKEQPGRVSAAELQSQFGVPQYNFDIESSDGGKWLIECNAATGVVTEVEQIVGRTNPLFKDQVRISEGDVKTKVSRFFPGQVVYMQYMIEANGQAMYDFNVKMKGSDRIMKFEVNATTGEVEAPGPVLWEIGKR